MTDSTPPSQPTGAWTWFRTYVLLMPPGVPLNHSEKRARKEREKQAAAGETVQPAPAGIDPWTQAAKAATAPEPLEAAPAGTATRRPAPAGPGSAGSWAVENEKTFGSALAKVLRVVLIVALVFVVLVGLRQLIFPVESTTVVQEVESTQFPAAAGGEVAARQVGAYLNIDPAEDALADRDAVLALDGTSTGISDSDGIAGKQTMSNVAVVRIAQIDGKRARALVTGTVTDYTATEGAWTPGAQRPIAAEVMLAADDTGAVTVVGRPSLVGTTPGTPAAAPPRNVAQDTTIGSATQDAGESFFSSYGADDQVTASVAPGASIVGLDGAATFERMTGWTVYEGNGKTRSAIATVTWSLPSGIEVTQTYALTLSSVSADDAGGWQISAISGGGTTQQ